MLTDVMRRRFEKALNEADPHSALFALAKSLKDEGVGQITVYHLFAEYPVKTDSDDKRYDAIVDNLDHIWGGPWSKGGFALYDRELTTKDVAHLAIDEHGRQVDLRERELTNEDVARPKDSKD